MSSAYHWIYSRVIHFAKRRELGTSRYSSRVLWLGTFLSEQSALVFDPALLKLSKVDRSGCWCSLIRSTGIFSYALFSPVHTLSFKPVPPPFRILSLPPPFRPWNPHSFSGRTYSCSICLLYKIIICLSPIQSSTTLHLIQRSAVSTTQHPPPMRSYTSTSVSSMPRYPPAFVNPSSSTHTQP